MQRRDLLTVLVSIPAARIFPAIAQPASRKRLIGILMGLREGDAEAAEYLRAFREALRALGWTAGQNLQIEFRAATDLESMKSRASELISLGPELVLTYTTPATNAARQATRSVPIIFVAVSDPIGTGFVESISHPGRNITGFTNFEPTMGSKWVGLIHEIVPSVQRVAMLFNPATANAGASGGVYLQSMNAATSVLGLELLVKPVSNPVEIDDAFAAVAELGNGAMSVMPNVFTASNKERIVTQAARFHVPTVYPLSHFVTAGGLISYGIDYVDQFRLAALYADHILKGAKVADLPVQRPIKFELVINRKTARELGLTIPSSMLATADTLID